MSKQFDGTKEKNRRRSGSDQCNSKDSSHGVGVLQANGGRNENDQIGSNQGNSPGESLIGRVQSAIAQGKDTPGKILESLKLIKEAHLAYVHAHRRRLEARLDENKVNESEFVQACDLLEEQIHNLIADPNLENS